MHLRHVVPLLLFISNVFAQAVVTTGVGSAVTSVQRQATFDPLVKDAVARDR